MKVYCFVGSSETWALTYIPSGDNLPDDMGPWHKLKELELLGIDEDEQEAEALIKAFGYCFFDDRSSHTH